MDGIVILDKGTGAFSRGASWLVAKRFGEKKFGHIGTLDPMATGVLVVAIGNATKMIPYIEEFNEDKKEYLFGLRFCVETDTLDIMGKMLKTNNVVPSKSDIKRACEIIKKSDTQIPPIFSAIHVGGKRAYELARAGKDIEMKPKPVKIYDLEYLGNSDEEYNFRVVCSRGTYVRSIVRDIAKNCGAIATTTYIRRTLSNGFSIKNAIKLDFLENLVNNNADIMKYLMPPDCALGDIPVINLNDKDAEFYKNGGFIMADRENGLVRVYANEKFIGIGRIQNKKLCPKRTI